MLDLSPIATRLEGWDIITTPGEAWEEAHPAGFSTIAPGSEGEFVRLSPRLIERLADGSELVVEAIAEWLDYSAVRITLGMAPDLIASTFAQDRPFQHGLLIAAANQIDLEPDEVFTTDFPTR